MILNSKQMGVALANSTLALRELDRFQCEKSLINFIKFGWAALEPGVEFVPNFAVHAICDHLEAVTYGDIKRLLINVPPGCTKSMSTNVFWPAWEWGPMALPHYRYLSFSHDVNLATRDNVRCRNLINSNWYQDIWGKQFTFNSDQNAKVYYENDKTGWRQACAASALTGRRGDRVLGDDPHSVEGAESDAKRDEVLRIFSETVPTRLNKQAESAIVVIMQRIHERDVSGLILANELGYEHLMIPMEFESGRRCYSTVKPSYIKNPKKEIVYQNKITKVWTPEPPDRSTINEATGAIITDSICDERYNVDIRELDGELLDPIRFPAESVESLKKAMRAWGGTYAEAGQLQQRPAPRGGGLFQKSDFQIIETMRGMTGKVVRGWDLAASVGKTSAYSAGVKMMLTLDGRIVIMDCNRFRKTPGAVEADIKQTAKADGKLVIQDIPQDPGQSGKSQKAAFAKLLHGFLVKFSPETGSKELRAGPLAAQCEAGNVYVLRGAWNDDFINEACMFPNGQFKDQIDGSSRAYASLLRKRPKKIGAAPKSIG